MTFLSWLRKSVRSSGTAGMLGVFNEIYNPSAHSAQIVVSEQNEAVKPKPAPTDKPKVGADEDSVKEKSEEPEGPSL